MIFRAGAGQATHAVHMAAPIAALALLPLACRRQPGKELLQTLAVVILGGLVSGTVLDEIITPTLLFVFGRKEFGDLVPRDSLAAICLVE